MIDAWFAMVVTAAAVLGSVALLVSIKRFAGVAPGGRCAACGGEPDRTRLACRGCGEDPRIVGLTPPRFRMMSDRCRLLLAAAVLVPIVSTSILPLLTTRLPMVMTVLAQPVIAWADRPRSGAYGGIRLTLRQQVRFPSAYEGELPAVAIIRLLDDRSLPTATLLAVREGGTWHVGSPEGPALEPGAVAEWIVQASGAAGDLALVEGADVLSLLHGAESPGILDPEQVGELSNEMTESFDRLRASGLRGPELQEHMAAIQRRVMSGVTLAGFADWEIPTGRGGGGGGMRSTGTKHQLKIAATAWILVSAAIVIGGLLLDRSRRRAGANPRESNIPHV